MTQPTLSPIGAVSAELRSWSLFATISTSEWSFGAECFVDQPEILAKAPLTLAPTGAMRNLSGGFRVALAKDDADAQAFLEACEQASVEIIGELSIAPDEVVARGALAKVGRVGCRVELHFESGVPHGTRPICRNARTIPELTNLKTDRYLPQIFGQGDVVAVPLFDLQESTLLSALGNDAVSLRLARPVSWPKTGRLQIDDEIMTYENFVSGSDVIGSADNALERPNPSEHRARSRVVLLPDTLDWCLADHAAAALEVREENADGDPVVDGAVVQRTLGGLPCTVFRSTRLPIVVTPGRTATTRETVRSSAQWIILPGTTAVEAGDAFNTSAPARGAILSEPGPTIQANYVQDLTRDAGRFDELRTAAFGFEFSDTPGWGPSTRLRVRISKGAATAEVLVNRDGVVIPVPVKGVAQLPTSGKSLSRAETQVLFFDRMVGEGTWSGLESAIDGRFQAAATISASADACALESSFVRERPEFSGRLLSIDLRARLRNAGPSPTDVRMVLALDSRLEARQAWTLAAGDSADLILPVYIPPDIAAADLFALGRFRLEFPAGTSVEVLEFWLETRSELAVIAALPSDLVQLPLLAATATGVRVTYNDVLLDIGAMLPTESWKFFSADGGIPQIEILLVDPPEDADWSVFVRDIHWKLTVIAASGARPVEKLWARINGRAVRADGTANPADAAAILLGDPAFGAVSAGLRNSASFTTASTEAASRNLGMRAVYQDSTPLAEVLGRVLAEGLLALALRSGKWSLWTVPVLLESSLPPVFPALELLECDIAEELDADPPAATPKPMLMVSGLDLMNRHFAGRKRTGWPAELLADARLAGLVPGMAFTFGGGWLAEVEQVRLRDGALSVRLAPRRRFADYFNTNQCRVRRTIPAHDLLFFIGARAVAKLTRGGDLLLRGTVHEQALSLAANPSIVVYHSATPLLAIHFYRNSTEYSAVAFDSAGNLLTSLPVREQAAITDPAPSGPGAMSLASSLLGGAPGGPAAMRLDTDALAVRGRIFTQRDL